jgi:tetratricopeptide (TPR) repeat protein
MSRFLSLLILVLITLGLSIPHVIAIPNREMGPTIEDSKDVLDLYPTKEPKSADDYYNLGLAYLRRGMFQMSSDNFQKALELDPKHVKSIIGLAASSFQIGDKEEALEYSDKAVKMEPNNAEVRNAIGEVFLANTNYPELMDKAEAKFKESISLDARLLMPRINLAQLYIAKKNFQEAIKQYNAAKGVDPKNIAIRRDLATLYLNTGSIDKAIGEAQEIIKLNPKDPMSHNGIGELYLREGDTEKALSEFQEAVRLDPKYAPGYKNIGVIHVTKGELDKAIQEYQRALSYSPNYGDANAALGDVYLAKNMIQEAKEEYEKAINQVSIRNVSVKSLISLYNNLAYIYAEEDGDLDKALLMAKKARQVVPDHPGIADTLGWVYYKKGDYDEAVSNLEVAVEGMPDNPIVRYHLGASYYKQGNKDKALTELKKALQNNGDFEGAEEAKGLLKELESQ